MPMEMRTLIFSRGEMAEALRGFGAQAGVALPAGTIMYLTLSAAPDPEVTVKVIPEDGTTIETVEIGAEAMGGCLIHYCIDKSIPIPRQSERSLQVIGETMAIHFAMNESTVKLPAFV